MSTVLTREAENLGTNAETFRFFLDTVAGELVARPQAPVPATEEEFAPPAPGVYSQRAERCLAALERLLQERISAQVAAVLHQPQVQRLEATLTGLRGLAVATAAAGVEFEVCNTDLETLREDLEAAEDDVTKSAFFDGTARRGYLTAGASAVGLDLLDFTFTPAPADVKLLELAGRCGTKGQFVVGAPLSGKVLGSETDAFTGIPPLPHHYQAQLEEPANGSLRLLQQKGEAQHVVAGGPRVLLRPAYDPDRYKAKGLEFFREPIRCHEDRLWGSPLWAFAQRYAASIAAHGWPSMVAGFEAGGAHEFAACTDEAGRYVAPVEIRVDDYVEKHLTECRLLTFYPVKDLPLAAALGIPSLYAPNPDAKDPGNERIAANAVYTLLRAFVSHRLKDRMRRALGRQLTVNQLRKDLDEWIKGSMCLGNGPDTASEAEKARRPFRGADVTVTQPVAGVFNAQIRLYPNLSIEEAHAALTVEEDSN